MSRIHAARKWPARLAVVGLAVVGLQVATTEIASAHNQAVGGVAACESDGSFTVTWTLTNDWSTADTATVTSSTPSPATLSASTLTLGPTGSGTESGTITQSKIPAGTSSATLNVKGTWTDGTVVDSTGTVDLSKVCPATPPKHGATVPTFANGACVSGHITQPTITIPSDSGVAYTLDSKSVTSGVHTVTAGTHTITASSTVLTLTGATTWTFKTLAAAADCGAVTPVSPSVTQSVCSGSTPTAPQLVVPNTANITYTVSKSGPYQAGQSVVVTAVAAAGHILKLPSGWQSLTSTTARTTVQFAAAPTCTVPATVITPGFTSAVCTGTEALTAGSFTVPSSKGVTYEVNGKAAQAGKYTAPWGSKITVVALPKPGYTVSGQTVWTRSFPTQAQCADTAGVTSNRTPDTAASTAQTAPVLASTGSPTESLLFGGIAAVVLGGLLTLLAGRRRQEQQ